MRRRARLHHVTSLSISVSSDFRQRYVVVGIHISMKRKSIDEKSFTVRPSYTFFQTDQISFCTSRVQDRISTPIECSTWRYYVQRTSHHKRKETSVVSTRAHRSSRTYIRTKQTRLFHSFVVQLNSHLLTDDKQKPSNQKPSVMWIRRRETSRKIFDKVRVRIWGV